VSGCNVVAFGFIDTRLTQAKETAEKIDVAGQEVQLACEPPARHGVDGHPDGAYRNGGMKPRAGYSAGRRLMPRISMGMCWKSRAGWGFDVL